MAQRMAGDKLKEHGIGTEKMQKPTSEGGTKGTLTAAATKEGKSPMQYARHVMAHKEDYSPKQVKKANFAVNFNKD